MSVPTAPAEPRFRSPARPVLTETLIAAVVTVVLYLLDAPWLALAGVFYTAACTIWLWHRAMGATVLTPAGIRSRKGLLRRRSMAWSDLWVIETVTNLRSRYVVVKGDHGRGFRLGGVIESRWRPTARFAEQSATLHEWATRSGNRFRSTPATRAGRRVFAIAMAVLIAGCLVLERAWFWLPLPQAAALPNPCQMLDPALASQLDVPVTGSVFTVQSLNGVVRGPGCVFTSNTSGAARYVKIGYARFDRTGLRGGSLKAALAYNDETWAMGEREVTMTDGGLGYATASVSVGDDAEVQNLLGVYGGFDGIDLVARRANVLIWVSVGAPPHQAGASHYTDAPDQAEIDAVVSVARPAIDAIQLS